MKLTRQIIASHERALEANQQAVDLTLAQVADYEQYGESPDLATFLDMVGALARAHQRTKFVALQQIDEINRVLNPTKEN